MDISLVYPLYTATRICCAKRFHKTDSTPHRIRSTRDESPLQYCRGTTLTDMWDRTHM
jgi:hypothetical protein